MIIVKIIRTLNEHCQFFPLLFPSLIKTRIMAALFFDLLQFISCFTFQSTFGLTSTFYSFLSLIVIVSLFNLEMSLLYFRATSRPICFQKEERFRGDL